MGVGGKGAHHRGFFTLVIEVAFDDLAPSLVADGVIALRDAAGITRAIYRVGARATST